MIPNNLPAGTKIRCIKPDYYLELNKIYTVVNYTTDGFVVIDDNSTASWFLNRFELVEPISKPFKEWVKGDIVKCVKGRCFGLMQNKTYIIDEIRYNENTLKVVKGSCVWWHLTTFEWVRPGQALESKHFSKWEVGDSIECIDNASLATTIGVIYEIKGMTPDKKFVEIVGDNGIFYALNSKLFKAVPLDKASSENSPAKVTDMTETKPEEPKSEPKSEPKQVDPEITESIAGWYRDDNGYYTQIDAEGTITHNCPLTTIGRDFSEDLYALGVKVDAPPQLPPGFQWPGGFIQERIVKKGDWLLDSGTILRWSYGTPSSNLYFVVEKMKERPKFEDGYYALENGLIIQLDAESMVGSVMFSSYYQRIVYNNDGSVGNGEYNIKEKLDNIPEIPEGYENRMEYRIPNKGEWYLTKDAFCPLKAVDFTPERARFIVFEAATSVASQPQQGEEMQTRKAEELIVQLQRELDALKAPVAKASDTTPKIPAFFGYVWAAAKGVFRFTVAEPGYRLYRLASRPFIVLAQTTCLAAVVAGIGYLGYAKAPSYQSIKAMIPTIQFGEAVEKSAPIEAE